MSEVEIYEGGPLVLGEPLMDIPEIEAEWTGGSYQVLSGAFRMARAAEHARIKGEGTWEHLMREMGAEKSWLYSLANCWRTYGERILDGTLSTRLESPLTISHFIEATKADDPMSALDMAEDEGLSVRQLRARIGGDDAPQNVETIEMMSCPKCGECYALSEAMTWTDTR